MPHKNPGGVVQQAVPKPRRLLVHRQEVQEVAQEETTAPDDVELAAPTVRPRIAYSGYGVMGNLFTISTTAIACATIGGVLGNLVFPGPGTIAGSVLAAAIGTAVVLRDINRVTFVDRALDE